MSTNVIVTFKSKPEKLAEFAKLLNQAKNDPCIFTLVETWESETDHKKNIENMVASGFWSHLATHLACDPTSGYYKEL